MLRLNVLTNQFQYPNINLFALWYTLYIIYIPISHSFEIFIVLLWLIQSATISSVTITNN